MILPRILLSTFMRHDETNSVMQKLPGTFYDKLEDNHDGKPAVMVIYMKKYLSLDHIIIL